MDSGLKIPPRDKSVINERARSGADAHDFTFVIAGNFTLDAIRPLVERYLGGLPSSDRQEQGRFNGDDPVRGQQELTILKGIEPKASVHILFTGDAPWNDEARYPLRAAVDVLLIQLREALREELGGTYSVGVYGNLNRVPKGTYACGIEFGCNPDQADALIQTALAEVRQLQTEGPSEVNLAKVKEQHLRGFEVAIKENPFWVNNLIFRAQNDLDLSALLDFPEKPRHLTPEAVARAAQDYFKPDNRFIARLLPEMP